MILKIKAFIYRMTGIYLAHKEQCSYMESKEFWNSFTWIANDSDFLLGLDHYTIAKIAIGLWQAEHKFYRKISF